VIIRIYHYIETRTTSERIHYNSIQSIARTKILRDQSLEETLKGGRDGDKDADSKTIRQANDVGNNVYDIAWLAQMALLGNT
jgi:hypothetical protein